MKISPFEVLSYCFINKYNKSQKKLSPFEFIGQLLISLINDIYSSEQSVIFCSELSYIKNNLFNSFINISFNLLSLS